MGFYMTENGVVLIRLGEGDVGVGYSDHEIWLTEGDTPVTPDNVLEHLRVIISFKDKAGVALFRQVLDRIEEFIDLDADDATTEAQMP